MPHLPRRQFIRTTTATGFSLMLPGALTQRVTLPSSDTIGIAIVGLRGRGRSHMQAFLSADGARVTALCDPDRHVLEKSGKECAAKGSETALVADFRDLLERDDVDAVSIATPNHWHALMTVWACQAGMDVYVEKPVSHNPWEGRQMVHAARTYDRIVQTGTQSRSNRSFVEAISWMHEGNLGRILLARGLCYKPRQSIGRVDGDQPVPAHIDYDLWTGPAPMKPLQRKNLHYDWHWVFDTGNGDLGNQGIHQMDICRWAAGLHRLPSRITSVGGRFGYEDDGNTPNTIISWFESDGPPMVFEVRGLPNSKAAQTNNWGGNMDRYRGTRIGVIVHCEGGHLTLEGSTAVAYDNDGSKIRSWSGSSSHFENFLTAVRSRDRATLHADIEEGHLSSAMCHLGNIAYARSQVGTPEDIRSSLGERAGALESLDRMITHLNANEVDLTSTPLQGGTWISVDPEREAIIDDPLAAAMARRPGRAPFTMPETV